MTESKLREGLEEQEFSSFYRVDVYCRYGLHTMLDPKNPEDQNIIPLPFSGKVYFPFRGEDYFYVMKDYSLYTLDRNQVFERVKEVKVKDKTLYTIRVYQIPLNSWIFDDDDDYDYDDITVFNSKGEMVVNSEREMFKAGEIVEYHDLNKDEVRLAIVYEPPKFEEVSLITLQGNLFTISTSYVSRPSFPVGDSYKEKLGNIYKKILETKRKEVRF